MLGHRLVARLLASLVAFAAFAAAPELTAQRGRGSVANFTRIDTALFALTNVRVIDGTGAAAKANQTVVVRNGSIAAVGDAGHVVIPAGALVLDMTGKSVIPGLVMVHEHLYYPNTGGWYGIYDESFTRLYLAGGVTSMRTAGDVAGYTDFAIKQQIDAGLKPGPWIDATAPYLQGPGGVAGQMYLLKDAADARRMVNFWADAGATSFKAYMNITRDELRAAIEEVHKRGLKITGHLCSVTYREAAEMGIDNLEHGFFVATDFVANKQPDTCPGQAVGMQAVAALDTGSAAFRSLIQLLVQRKVAVTSTLTVFETFTPGRPMPPGIDVLTPQLKEQFEQTFARTARNTASPYSKLFPKAAAMEVAFAQSRRAADRRDGSHGRRRRHSGILEPAGTRVARGEWIHSPRGNPDLHAQRRDVPRHRGSHRVDRRGETGGPRHHRRRSVRADRRHPESRAGVQEGGWFRPGEADRVREGTRGIVLGTVT